jgi:hypothetical protein
LVREDFYAFTLLVFTSRHSFLAQTVYAAQSAVFFLGRLSLWIAFTVAEAKGTFLYGRFCRATGKKQSKNHQNKYSCYRKFFIIHGHHLLFIP